MMRRPVRAAVRARARGGGSQRRALDDAVRAPRLDVRPRARGRVPAASLGALAPAALATYARGRSMSSSWARWRAGVLPAR